MATYLARPCPRCNGYLGIVLREPGRNTPVRAVNGHCVKCGYRLAWIVIKGSSLLASSHERRDMLNPQKTLEREAMLKRIRELDAEIAQLERNLREGEARLPIEEQLCLRLQRFIEVTMPELGKVRVEIHRKIFFEHVPVPPELMTSGLRMLEMPSSTLR